MDLSPVLLFGVVVIVIWLFNSLNVLREYERGVIFRIGRLLPEPISMMRFDWLNRTFESDRDGIST